MLTATEKAMFTIESFLDSKRQQSAGAFAVQFNPETLSLHYEAAIHHSAPVSGLPDVQWCHNAPSTLNVTLIFDGTRPTQYTVDSISDLNPFRKPDATLATVAARVQHFIATCSSLNSETHQAKYLRLRWGSDIVWNLNFDRDQSYFDCRLQSADIQYLTFARNGAPLHAEVQASFIENFNEQKAAAMANLHSPDLTQRRVVRAGDTLAALCLEVYGSSRHYLRVAQANRLDNFRSLPAGLELIFPPFEKGR